MPTPSRWMIRCSFIYLLIGFLMGGLLLIGKAFPSYYFQWFLLPVHIEVVLFGWIIQFTLGTAYWILPRFLEGPPRGDIIWGKLMVLSLNLGIFLTVLSYLRLLPNFGTLIGRIFETASVALFIYLHWNRIVTYRN